MNPDLRRTLQEQLRRRAERLTKMAAIPACPSVVLALTTEQVVTTAMLLCGEDVARRLFERILKQHRTANGVCMCGKAQIVPDLNLCAACIKEVDAMDKELDQALAMETPTKGAPS